MESRGHHQLQEEEVLRRWRDWLPGQGQGRMEHKVWVVAEEEEEPSPVAEVRVEGVEDWMLDCMER